MGTLIDMWSAFVMLLLYNSIFYVNAQWHIVCRCGECCVYVLWSSCGMRLNKAQNTPEIVKFMGPAWGPPGSCRPQIGPMLAPWNLFSGIHKIVSNYCTNHGDTDMLCASVKTLGNWIMLSVVWVMIWSLICDIINEDSLEFESFAARFIICNKIIPHPMAYVSGNNNATPLFFESDPISILISPASIALVTIYSNIRDVWSPDTSSISNF